MLLSLTDVKINGTYTHLNSGAPTVAEKQPLYLDGDRWLDLVTGYSYALTDQIGGTWVQIELDLDARILRVADNTTKTIMGELSNYFILDRNGNYTDIQDNPYFPNNSNRSEQFMLMMYECVYSTWTYAAVGKTITVGDDIFGTLGNFVAGDTLYISKGLRNNGFYTIDSITSTEITVLEDIVNGEENAFICLSIISQGFKNIVGSMIYFDVVERPQLGAYKSEKIGTYSYTLGDWNNGLKYPDSVVAGIDFYHIIAMGGLDVFIN
jgi:hypothetical protein